jgi:hypothetical protein
LRAQRLYPINGSANRAQARRLLLQVAHPLLEQGRRLAGLDELPLQIGIPPVPLLVAFAPVASRYLCERSARGLETSGLNCAAFLFPAPEPQFSCQTQHAQRLRDRRQIVLSNAPE